MKRRNRILGKKKSNTKRNKKEKKNQIKQKNEQKWIIKLDKNNQEELEEMEIGTRRIKEELKE